MEMRWVWLTEHSMVLLMVVLMENDLVRRMDLCLVQLTVMSLEKMMEIPKELRLVLLLDDLMEMQMVMMMEMNSAHLMALQLEH